MNAMVFHEPLIARQNHPAADSDFYTFAGNFTDPGDLCFINFLSIGFFDA